MPSTGTVCGASPLDKAGINALHELHVYHDLKKYGTSSVCWGSLCMILTFLFVGVFSWGLLALICLGTVLCRAYSQPNKSTADLGAVLACVTSVLLLISGITSLLAIHNNDGSTEAQAGATVGTISVIACVFLPAFICFKVAKTAREAGKKAEQLVAQTMQPAAGTVPAQAYVVQPGYQRPAPAYVAGPPAYQKQPNQHSVQHAAPAPSQHAAGVQPAAAAQHPHPATAPYAVQPQQQQPASAPAMSAPLYPVSSVAQEKQAVPHEQAAEPKTGDAAEAAGNTVDPPPTYDAATNEAAPEESTNEAVTAEAVTEEPKAEAEPGTSAAASDDALVYQPTLQEEPAETARDAEDSREADVDEAPSNAAPSNDGDAPYL